MLIIYCIMRLEEQYLSHWVVFFNPVLPWNRQWDRHLGIKKHAGCLSKVACNLIQQDDQSVLIETSSWNQRFFSAEPPQLIIRDSHYMVLQQTFPYQILLIQQHKSWVFFRSYFCLIIPPHAWNQTETMSSVAGRSWPWCPLQNFPIKENTSFAVVCIPLRFCLTV